MGTLPLTWRTETKQVRELTLWDKNPRKMSSKEREDLHNSFSKFNYVEIIVINLDNRVIGGHQRLNEIVSNGNMDESIDVRVPNRLLSEPEFEELAVRLNKNHGQWDDVMLAKFFDGDNLRTWGFDEQELSSIFDDALEVTDDDFDVDEEYAAIITPTSKKGDLYILGDHRLLCGDATSQEDVTRLMVDRATVIYCDPPYNTGLYYDKGVKGSSTKKTYTNTRFNDSKKPQDYVQWLNTTIQNAKAGSAKDAHVFYWCDPKNIGLVQQSFNETGVKNKNVCFWIKNQFNPIKQIAFNRVYEPCVYGTIGKPYLNDNIKNLSEILNKGQEGQSIEETVMSFVEIWYNKRDITNNYVHPTQKPVTLHEKPLKRCSSPGDVVLDMFGGSGSTLIACEQLKRKARLIEMDPVFCDVIVKRWEKLTGREAELYA